MARVLVVDDEDVLAEMVATLLEELGYQAMTATNGQEALDALEGADEPPALIIADVMMPRMSGSELARALKAHPRLRHVPVILISAAGRPRDDQAADAFLHKPFDLDTLAELIEQHARPQSEHSHNRSEQATQPGEATGEQPTA
jgi:two-component system, OmpR family, response regulator VicR